LKQKGNKMSIEEQTLDVLIKQLEKSADEITSAGTWKDLGLGSLDVMEIIFVLEDEFKIEIPDDDYPALSNFRKLVDYIQDKMK